MDGRLNTPLTKKKKNYYKIGDIDITDESHIPNLPIRTSHPLNAGKEKKREETERELF